VILRVLWVLMLSFRFGAGDAAAHDPGATSGSVAAGADGVLTSRMMVSGSDVPRLVDAIVPGLSRRASPRLAPLAVDLLLDAPRLPPRLEASALEEVNRIWAPYGVDVRFQHADDAVRCGAVRLAVALGNRPDGLATAHALGSIHFHGDEPEPAIEMYSNAIEQLVSTATLYDHENRKWPTSFRHFIVGRVLGRALAHEIGHFLLRTRHHSAAGLMRSELASADLVSPSRRPFALSAVDAARLAFITRND
jgi:hypothetical protein